ncbi:hypothetical protein [Methylobacterium sp. J-067]|uniref:hypothetical protein n=1 Tax=Methylobacterium sp. J-067 TaxID=2836648 RepID=UPI001FBAF74C|nr:hypothetical protein [Methylobacterium sp. J-067]MCJ2024058.1 hypothetical protein [Methylobacterium sp. J-067]
MIKLTKAAAKSPPEADRGTVAQLPEELNASAEPGSPKPTPALIVFGPDRDGKPHASWFAEADVVLATKAAGVMGMRTLPLADEAAFAIAAQLPQGRVFASGRAFVPFVAKGAYGRLSALAGPGELTAPAEGAKAAGGPANAPGGPSTSEAPLGGEDGRYPRSWASVGVGSLVLISEGEQDGWYEAEVVEAKTGGIYTLRWRDWPDLPLLVRRREHMALLHPNTAAAEAA